MFNAKGFSQKKAIDLNETLTFVGSQNQRSNPLEETLTTFARETRIQGHKGRIRQQAHNS